MPKPKSKIIHDSNINRRDKTKYNVDILNNPFHTRAILLMALGCNTKSELLKKGITIGSLNNRILHKKFRLKGNLIKINKKFQKEWIYNFDWNFFITNVFYSLLITSDDNPNSSYTDSASKIGGIKKQLEKHQSLNTIKKRNKSRKLEQKLDKLIIDSDDKLYYTHFSDVVDSIDTIKEILERYFTLVLTQKNINYSINQILNFFLISIGSNFKILEDKVILIKTEDNEYEFIFPDVKGTQILTSKKLLEKDIKYVLTLMKESKRQKRIIDTLKLFYLGSGKYFSYIRTNNAYMDNDLNKFSIYVFKSFIDELKHPALALNKMQIYEAKSKHYDKTQQKYVYEW